MNKINDLLCFLLPQSELLLIDEAMPCLQVNHKSENFQEQFLVYLKPVKHDHELCQIMWQFSSIHQPDDELSTSYILPVAQLEPFLREFASAYEAKENEKLSEEIKQKFSVYKKQALKLLSGQSSEFTFIKKNSVIFNINPFDQTRDYPIFSFGKQAWLSLPSEKDSEMGFNQASFLKVEYSEDTKDPNAIHYKFMLPMLDYHHFIALLPNNEQSPDEFLKSLYHKHKDKIPAFRAIEFFDMHSELDSKGKKECKTKDMKNIDLLTSHVRYLLDKTGAIIRTGPSGCSVFNKKEGIRFENPPTHPSSCKIGLFQEVSGVSFPKLEVEVPCSEVMCLIDEIYQKQDLYHGHVSYHGHDTNLLSLVEEGLKNPQLEFLHNLVNLDNYKILMTIEEHDYYLDISKGDLRESNLIGSMNISIESASKTIDVSSELNIRYTEFYKYPILQPWQPKTFKIEQLLHDFFEEAKKNFSFVQAFSLENELSRKNNSDNKGKTKI